MDQTNHSNHNAGPSGGSTGKKKAAKKGRAGRILGRIFLLLFTLCVIGVLTFAIFFKIFMTYVDTTLLPSLEDYSSVDMTVRLSSRMYDRNGDEMLMLYKDENRELVELDQIPQHMIDALIAIEDKRFYEHKGVDWKGTAAAFYKTFTSGSTRGGSTLTQQVVRHIWDDKDVTVKRKIREIFRSLKFEADLAAEYDETYAKNFVLEYYLNQMYFGQSCYGVQAAAKMYFGKDVSELDLAESACIIGITNNPSLYDPFYDKEFKQQDGSVKTPRQFNKVRQETILKEMLDQNYITEEEYQTAKDEFLMFRDTPEYAALHRGETDEEESGEDGGEDEDSVGLKKVIYSWYEDAAIEEAIGLVQEALGVSRTQAIEKVYSGGYLIHTNFDPDIQAIVDEVFENPANFDYPSAKGTPLDGAITILDNYTGEVLAMAGGVGEKTTSRSLNLATSPRAVGSAIKPLSVYAPAIEAGVIGPGTPVDDFPYKLNDMGTGGYPRNSNYKYRGWTTVASGVQSSINAVACRVLLMGGVENAFEFMENKLGFDLAGADMDVSPLGMGSLTTGVSTMQMAAAYASFANEGVYTYPRLISRITDSEGNIIVDNQPKQQVAMKESTAYFMNKMLRSVVSGGGTGTSANFSGMTIAGKTGSTASYCDRYFVGYTPYYSAAVWVGYSQGSEKINSDSKNPAALAWKMVMQKVHEGLENKSFFDKPSGITTVQVCADCGLKPSELCASDVRGSRVITAEIPVGAEPEGTCTCHVAVEICTEASADGYVLAGEHCPASCRSTIVISQSRELMEVPYDTPVTLEDGTVRNGEAIVAADSNYQLSYLRWKGTCTVHDENSPDEPLLPGDPGYEWPDGLGPWPGNDPGTDPGSQPTDPAGPSGGDTTAPQEPSEPVPPTEPTEPDVPNVG